MISPSVAPSESVVTGVVEAVNERGIKINGAWTNISKFAVGVVLPERGETVALTLDKSGFIRSCDPANGYAVDGSSKSGGGPPGAAGLPDSPGRSSAARDRTITRLAVLKAAAEFGAARPQLKSGHILSIAASWERWITREEDTTFNLDDEF
jgi:hypothetical protein